MDALTLLHTRNSSPKLCEPAPDEEALHNMLKAALRSPDHSRLRPWRFLTIAGENRLKFGQLMVEATRARKSQSGEAAMSVEEEQKLANKALRAPLIMVVIAVLKDHPKVPEIEQVISAGCAAHGILLAAHAEGFAGIWRTGANAYDEVVEAGLGLNSNEKIVGFLYLGTVDGNYKTLREMPAEEFCQPWTGFK